MSDRYGELVQSNIGKTIAKNLGLPTPVALERYEVGQPVLTGEVLLGFGNNNPNDNTDNSVKDALLASLSNLRAMLATDPFTISYAQGFQGVLNDSLRKIHDEHSRFKVVIFDASNLASVKDLERLHEFFHPIAKKIKLSGRVIIIGRPDCCTTTLHAKIAQRALQGFVKSLAKELKRGIAVNLIYVKKSLENQMDSTLRFLMSSKSAYVSGQVITLDNTAPQTQNTASLVGKKILVTGASRGIGAAISEVLAMEGADVICADLPTGLNDLQNHSDTIKATALALDITDPNAAQTIINKVGTLDGIVHNAGITQDKTLAKMSIDKWQAVMAVNLQAILDINSHLLDNGGLSNDGKIVCISSISGIAGNLGQTNYATSKAGVIGLVEATAPLLNNQQTINAVAPAFIETKMTAAMPFAVREAGRRMNAMSQGGQPVDVAHTVAWLLNPNSIAINGQTVRVCGQSILGS